MTSEASPSVAELNVLFKQLSEQRVVKEQADKIASEQNEIYRAIESKIVSLMDTLEVSSVACEFGKFTKVNRKTVRVPQGDDKSKFFEYMKHLGIFEPMVTIHSQTLNSWYKEEAQRAESTGKVFNPPGLGLPNIHSYIQIRK